MVMAHPSDLGHGKNILNKLLRNCKGMGCVLAGDMYPFSPQWEEILYFEKHPIIRALVNGCVWLCMAVYDCVWLCMTVYGCVGLCMALYGCVWLCIAVYDCVWLCITVYDSVWLCMAVFGCVLQCMAFYGCVCRAPTGTGNMILQRSKNSRLILWKGKLTDTGGRPVLQRQSRSGAEKDSQFCSYWLSSNTNWPLPCRDSQQREQKKIPVLVWKQIPVLAWEQDLIEVNLSYIWRCILC